MHCTVHGPTESTAITVRFARGAPVFRARRDSPSGARIASRSSAEAEAERFANSAGRRVHRVESHACRRDRDSERRPFRVIALISARSAQSCSARCASKRIRSGQDARANESCANHRAPRGSAHRLLSTHPLNKHCSTPTPTRREANRIEYSKERSKWSKRAVGRRRRGRVESRREAVTVC